MVVVHPGGLPVAEMRSVQHFADASNESIARCSSDR
jgi:hypothetical protein